MSCLDVWVHELNVVYYLRNMYMAEDYNSPQSPYWCLKALIAVSLAQDDEFWTVEEQAYPPSLFKPKLVPAPRQIVSNHPEANHHFMLSPAQFVAWPLKASQAKYSKFEYSSSFAFSVPTGPLIQQIAPDCMLALSRDGAETWAVKWKCAEASFSSRAASLRLQGQSELSMLPLMAASVRWRPWGDGQVEVETTLIPPTDRWPDWHIRVHRIRVRSGQLRSLHTVEGGFATHARCVKDGATLPTLTRLGGKMEIGSAEGVLQEEAESHRSALILSATGASGVSSTVSTVKDTDSSSKAPAVSAYALKPDSNTNLAQPRTLIPVVARDVAGDLVAGDHILAVTSIFAVSANANGGRNASTRRSLEERWSDKPRILLRADPTQEVDCILLTW